MKSAKNQCSPSEKINAFEAEFLLYKKGGRKLQSVADDREFGTDLLQVCPDDCEHYFAINPSIEIAPAPPNTRASAIKKSANVYSMPLPLPGP